jgi:hypothetical protein
MKSSIAIAAVLLGTAHQTYAQTGYVTNALGSQSSRSNVLAPRMLATVSETPTLSGSIGVVLTLSQAASVTADVFIRPAGSAASIPAQVISTTSRSATFLVPSNIPTGSAELIWRIGDQPYQWINVTVAAANFELSPTQPPLGLATPARPGQVVALIGSGLGASGPLTATVAGRPAKVVSAGPGATLGYDQIQLEIPAATAPGCYVPFTVSAGDGSASSVMPVTNDGAPCQHPLHLSAADLKNLDAGNSIATLALSVGTTLNATCQQRLIALRAHTYR